MAILGYDGLKCLKLSIETLTVTHDLLQIPENPLFQKRTLIYFYICVTISGIITVNMQW